MNMVHSKNADLNLLKIFDSLARNQNVSRSAHELHLTQSAVSHALARLREMFGDPLFVRGPRGVLPTSRALALEKSIRNILADTELLLKVSGFDPATHVETFNIITTDYFEVVALPKLIGVLARLAPGISVVSRPTPDSLPATQLEAGTTDVAIAGFYGTPPAGFFQQKLFSDEFVVLARKKHPRIDKTLSLERYLKEDHIRIALHGDLKGELDRYLDKKKMSRKVVAGLSNFTSPSWILAETDLLLTAPKKLAERYAEYLPVRLFPSPIELKPLSVMQVWHARTKDDPFRKWMRLQIKNLFETP